MKKLVLFFSLAYFTFGLHAHAQEADSGTFTNPLLLSGADPFAFYKDGFYYYTHTVGYRIDLWKTKSLAELKAAEHKTIFVPPDGTAYSRNLWAPEVHFIKGKWYTYFAADDGNNDRHRLYVLENASPDPMQGEWKMRGKISDPSDKWAIDGNVFRYKGKLYLVWSGWEGDTDGQQDIYIARLKNPWTVRDRRVRIASPTLDWEKQGGVHVNEGPQFLENNGKLFIVYSASGCWTDFYALGLLTFTGKGDLLDAANWKKSERPVFRQLPEHGVYAPGHNSFFTSPDGKESWILYHANDEPGQGCGRFRSPRMQKFCWNLDGTPNFGQPVKTGVPAFLPSENTPVPVSMP